MYFRVFIHIPPNLKWEYQVKNENSNTDWQFFFNPAFSFPKLMLKEVIYT